MLKSFLGIKLNHSSVLAWLFILTIVAVQLVNRFVYNVKASDNVLLSNDKSLQKLARDNYAGFTDPFFQIAAANMYAKDRKYNLHFIVNAIIYYFFLISGLVLSECLLGHFNMIILVVLGMMVSYLTSAMNNIYCKTNTPAVGMVGGVYCCGEHFAWFMSGVTMAILLNYHFFKTKKVSTFMLGLLFLVFGAGILMYEHFFNMKQLDKSNGVEWCMQATSSVRPYLFGGVITMGMMGLLFKTH